MLGGEGGGVATISASVTPDGWGQIQAMLSSFWADPSVTPEAAAAQFAAIIAQQG